MNRPFGGDLEVVGGDGHGHRRAGERDRDRRAELDALGALGRGDRIGRNPSWEVSAVNAPS